MQKPANLPSQQSKPAIDRLTDRELLQQLADFLNKREFIHSDEASIRDMMSRYSNPPFTLRNRAAMRMSVTELNHLNTFMQKVNNHLQSTLHKEPEASDDR